MLDEVSGPEERQGKGGELRRPPRRPAALAQPVGPVKHNGERESLQPEAGPPGEGPPCSRRQQQPEPDKAEVDTQTRLHGGETPRRIRRRAEAVERHRRSEPRAALQGDGAQRAGD